MPGAGAGKVAEDGAEAKKKLNDMMNAMTQNQAVTAGPFKIDNETMARQLAEAGPPAVLGKELEAVHRPRVGHRPGDAASPAAG